MDVSELIAMKKKLETDIQTRIEVFVHETGLRPDISVYTDTIEYVGQPSRHIARVDVSVKI